MFSQSLRRRLAVRSALPRTPVSRPASAASPRACITTQSRTTNDADTPEPILNSTAAPPAARKPLNPKAQSSAGGPLSSSAASASTTAEAPLPEPTSSAPSSASTPLSDSVRTLLPLLRAQAPHYITAHIHAKPYLVTVGDTVRLPFRMHGVEPGDVLRLNRASLLGSRDYSLKAGAKAKAPRGSQVPGADPDPGYIDDRLFVCRATVMGLVSEPLRIMEKTKRRRRHVKRVKSKHRYTVLRISELTVRSLDEIETGSTAGA